MLPFRRSRQLSQLNGVSTGVRRIKMMGLVAGVVVGAIFVFSVVRDSRPREPVLFLPYPYRAPVGWFDRIATMVPMSCGWFWRFMDRFRGPTVTLEAWVVELKTNVVNQSPNSLGINPQRDLGLGQPAVESTKGAMVWRLGPNEISALQNRLKKRSDVQVLAPSVSTSDSIQGTMFYGNTVSVSGAKVDVGLKVDFYPRVKGGSLDLLAEVMSSELLTNSEIIRTNIALAARLQLSNGCGVFVVPTNTAGNVYGVILSGNLTQPNGLKVRGITPVSAKH